MNKKYWLKFGLIFAILNIVISLIPYNMPDIRHPQGFSDFRILTFPNFTIGVPFIFVTRLISKPIINTYYDKKIQYYNDYETDAAFAQKQETNN